MPETESPRIDPRSFQMLLEERKSIVPYYTPEWDISDEKNVGFALLKIFIHMHEEVISRLNRVPEKNFTAFLDILGIRLIPAQCAKVPVTFYLSEGLVGGVFVPPRTQVATEETEKHEALIFETTQGFFATSAAVEEVYCTDPEKDEIYSYSNDLKEEKEFKIFVGEKNLQQHILYLGHGDFFNLKEPANIKLRLKLVLGSVNDLKDLIWEYWGEDENNPEKFDNVSVNEIREKEFLAILKKSKGEVKEKEINGRKNRWIQCRLSRITDKSIIISKIKIADVSPKESIKPDIGFYNSIPLDLSAEFYPFGAQPRLFDTFYIASKEVFTKKKANITITFMKSDVDVTPSNSVELSWEYWNGSLWRPLEKEDTLGNFSKDGDVVFNCPEDLKEFEVNGEKNYWIRVRLVKGDYGKDEFKKDATNEVWNITSNFKPPKISYIGVKYFSEDETELQCCLAYNNLEYRDFTKENKEGNSFKPFIPLPEKQPTFYLGFKDAFRKGNISIFFSLSDKDYPQYARPKIQWTYWNRVSNLLESVTDLKKINLTSMEGIGTGTELIFEEPSGTSGSTSEGKGTAKPVSFITQTAIVESYSDTEITLMPELDYKYTRAASVFKRTYLEVSDNTEYLTKSGTLEFIGPAEQFKTHKFGKESYWLMGILIKPKAFETPLIKGIYPNTVWAEEVETIEDEILGSSDGEKNKSYKFIKSPVISPEIWVREGKIISQDERDTLSSEDIREVKDDTGKTTEMWTRWKAVDDLMDSDPWSRDCTVDSSMGIVQFGDGEHGIIPPIGNDNIKANYKSGGGVKGNVMRSEINVLKTPIAGIDHVINHKPAEGGSDTELLSEVFERGPHLIKHRNKAVTVEDFERLAREASSYIARTKCITEHNKLKIIIIPKGEEDKPQPSLGLTKVVKNHLLKRNLNLIYDESIEVDGPVYREVKVTVDVVPVSIDRAVPLEKEILKRLREYLHPLTGGNERRGWEFGRGVHISDIYTLLEGIEGVDHVENLKLNGDSYLFCWDNIPGDDENRLIKFLRDYLDINWVDNARIEKIDMDGTIRISAKEMPIEIALDESREKAILKISDDITYYLLVKKESGKRNIYSKDLYIEKSETVCSGEHKITMKLGRNNDIA